MSERMGYQQTLQQAVGAHLMSERMGYQQTLRQAI
jgi:hypothetical protein